MLVNKRVIQIILGAVFIVLMNGCEDKIKETNNNITVPRATYNQLLDSLETSKVRLKEAREENKVRLKEAREENIELRNNNQTLDVNLAKSELTFTKKTEKEVTIKLISGAVVLILILGYLGSLYFNREIKRKNTQLDEKQKRINILESVKQEMEENQKISEKLREELSKDLEVLKLKQKQSSLNSVVNKIDEHQTKRAQMINRIEVI